MENDMNQSEKVFITVNTRVQAPAEKAWACFTSPEHVTHWNQATPEWHCPKATNELRPGGKFCYTMAARDGSFSFDFSGTFDVVKAPNILNYTMDDGRTCHITFQETGAGIEVTETFEAESQNPIEMQQGGWQAILDSFKNYTESL